MNELNPEEVMRALECCSNLNCDGCPFDKPNPNCISGLPKAALALLREKDAERKELWEERCRIYESMREWEEECKKYRDALREKDAEIERLKHSKGVAQVNIINEITNRMRVKDFNSNEIATGYSWAINDLLKLLLELKKKVMRGNKDDSNQM